MTSPPSDQDHAHRPGAHGGTVVSIGLDSYHAEAIVERGGRLRLLMLGKDETRIQEVDEQSPTAYVKAAGGTESSPIELQPAPQDGDAPGKTSQFAGQLPEALAAGEIEVTIPVLRINGERFRIAFATTSPDHSERMPASLSAADERALYLTPGGVYTDADIAANGGVTAAEKFRGLKASHDMHPGEGDKVCPITETKANPRFSWVIAGKSYEFCCPPCVDEFVKLAKEDPTKVKEPSDYVKR